MPPRQSCLNSSAFHLSICFTFSFLEMHCFCHRKILCLSGASSLWTYQQNLKTVSHLETHHYRLISDLLLFLSLNPAREYININAMASDVLLLSVTFLLTYMHSIYAFALPRNPQISISAEPLVGDHPSISSSRTDSRHSSLSKTFRNPTPGTKGVNCKNVSVSTLYQDH